MSAHWTFERKNRENLIRAIGEGTIIESFYWDRGHKDGAEIHNLTDTGVVIIRNALTGKLITKIVARPYQIERYYRREHRFPPDWLMNLAEKRQELIYNIK